MLVDFSEAGTLIISTIQSSIGLLFVANIDGNICIDEIPEKQEKIHRDFLLWINVFASGGGNSWVKGIG